jgi:3-phosphoshikimate 1-carboxyvinyltransferase
MLFRVKKSHIGGRVRVPASKSHTIRALFIASIADGISEISNPLTSEDAMSALETCKALGADIEIVPNKFIIRGFNGKPDIPSDVINVGNSGTTLRFGIMTAALSEGCSVFTGDYQIRRRPLGPLIQALNNLGADVFSTRNNDMAPVVVRGRLKGGETGLDAVTSQYLSSILINSPLVEKNTEVIINRLNEIPYVKMTMWWMDKQGIEYHNENFKRILIKGGQKYRSFNITIPGDFSSAVFFMVIAAVSGGEIVLDNLDISDPQGDKAVLDILKSMGTEISVHEDYIRIKGKRLQGMEIDMNSIPDALPAMAVAGCFAEGETRLVNVPQARLKETDRIRVMYEELGKMGADIKELPDGLVIKKSKLRGCPVSGYNDHRVVMALTVAGLNIGGETVIDTAEAVNVTFPDFIELIRSCGGDILIT